MSMPMSQRVAISAQVKSTQTRDIDIVVDDNEVRTPSVCARAHRSGHTNFLCVAFARTGSIATTVEKLHRSSPSLRPDAFYAALTTAFELALFIWADALVSGTHV